MTSSSLIIDYLGEGLASARPTSLSISATALGLYFATDTKELSAWDGSAWQAVGGGSAGGPTGTTGAFSMGAAAYSSSAHAFKGNILLPYKNLTLYSVQALLNATSGNVFQAVLATYSGTTISAVTLSPTVTAAATNATVFDFVFASPVALTAGTSYALMVGITSGTGTTPCPAEGISGSQIRFARCQFLGLTNNVALLDQTAPAVSQTLTISGTNAISMTFQYA